MVKRLTCVQCAHFDCSEDWQITEYSEGICRRYPPKVYTTLYGQNDTIQADTSTIWPSVTSGDHCGEFIREVKP